MILEIEKTVIEGAAASGFAALLAHADQFKGRQVGIVMSGGNIDMRLLSNVILRKLTKTYKEIDSNWSAPPAAAGSARWSPAGW